MAVRRRLIQFRPAALVTVTFVLMASFVAWRFDVFRSPVSGYPAAPAPDESSRSVVAPPSNATEDPVIAPPATPSPPPEVLSHPRALPAPEAAAEASTAPRHRPRKQSSSRKVTVDAAPPRLQATTPAQEELRPPPPAPSRAEELPSSWARSARWTGTTRYEAWYSLELKQVVTLRENLETGTSGRITSSLPALTSPRLAPMISLN